MTQINEQQERDIKTAIATVSDYALDLTDAIADAEKALAADEPAEDVASKVHSIFARVNRLTEKAANAQAWFVEAQEEWTDDDGGEG